MLFWCLFASLLRNSGNKHQKQPFLVCINSSPLENIGLHYSKYRFVINCEYHDTPCNATFCTLFKRMQIQQSNMKWKTTVTSFVFLLEMVISIRHIGMNVVMAFILKNTELVTAECQSQRFESPIEGHSCEIPEQINASVIERHHCTMACIRSNHCKATVYDNRRSLCMSLSHPCVLLKPRAGYVYQAFHHRCVEWVLHGEDVPAYFIHERITTGKTNIGRVFVDDDLVVGKVVPHLNRFYSVHLSGTSDVRLNTGYEKLAADASWSVTWVWYDATKGQPLPNGAFFIGGYVVTTATPLYVSRLMPTDNLLVVGYYNPQNRKAWGLFDGIKSGATFEVMVIQPV